jgi:hypothetical protein
MRQRQVDGPFERQQNRCWPLCLSSVSGRDSLSRRHAGKPDADQNYSRNPLTILHHVTSAGHLTAPRAFSISARHLYSILLYARTELPSLECYNSALVRVQRQTDKADGKTWPRVKAEDGYAEQKLAALNGARDVEG